jgi:hypothetical protein
MAQKTHPRKHLHDARNFSERGQSANNQPTVDHSLDQEDRTHTAISPCGHDNAQRGVHHQRHQTIAYEAAHLVEFDVTLVTGHAIHNPVQTAQNNNRKAENVAELHFSSLEAQGYRQ